MQKNKKKPSWNNRRGGEPLKTNKHLKMEQQQHLNLYTLFDDG